MKLSWEHIDKNIYVDALISAAAGIANTVKAAKDYSTRHWKGGIYSNDKCLTGFVIRAAVSRVPNQNRRMCKICILKLKQHGYYLL